MLEDSIYSSFIPLVLKVNLITKGGFEEGDLGTAVWLPIDTQIILTTDFSLVSLEELNNVFFLPVFW